MVNFTLSPIKYKITHFFLKPEFGEKSARDTLRYNQPKGSEVILKEGELRLKGNKATGRFEKDIVNLVEESGALNELISSVNEKLGTKQFGQKLGYLLAGVDNVFDTYYYDHLDWNSVPRPGRNFFLKLQYQFN